jgi:hypothetical protein
MLEAATGCIWGSVCNMTSGARNPLLVGVWRRSGARKTSWISCTRSAVLHAKFGYTPATFWQR